MVLFLRNKKNETILDVEVFVKIESPNRKFVELHSVVRIDTYSKFLLDNVDIADDIISAFYDLSELRGWLWETFFGGGLNEANDYQQVVKEVSQMLKDVAEKYDLKFVTD